MSQPLAMEQHASTNNHMVNATKVMLSQRHTQRNHFPLKSISTADSEMLSRAPQFADE